MGKNLVAGLVILILAAALLTGCAVRALIPIEMLKEPPCYAARGVLWAGPKASDHRARLSNWCQSVGPVIISSRYYAPPVDVSFSGLIVVTWNKHADYGDLERLLRSLGSQSAMVVLVQEVVRRNDQIPVEVPSRMKVPRRIAPQHARQDIMTIATKFNMSLVYLPSMPNGNRTQEDRGCAILSTLPLSDVVGIELPWVSQRRAAIMATVSATNNGLPWRLRVVSVHLDNRGGRARQAAALADFLTSQPAPELPIVIGGDLNAWYGIRDQAVFEIDRVVPRIPECGDRATFPLPLWLGLRLDHLFTTLPQAARTRCFVEPETFGSDHRPIVLHLFK